MKTNQKQVNTMFKNILTAGQNLFQRRFIALVVMFFAFAIGIQADGYITEVMTIGSDRNDVKSEYRKKGWTVVDKDLNSGGGGWWIYVAYKTSSKANPEKDYITDICVSDKCVDNFMFEGRKYYRCANNSGYNGNLNRGISSGADLWLYYTRDRNKLNSFGKTKRVMTELLVNGKQSMGDNWIAPIVWRNGRSGICDLNSGAGGEYIYLHQHFTTQKTWFATQPTFAGDMTFNGNKRDLVTKNPWKENDGHGQMRYRVNGGSWSGNIPTATNVGNYKVEACLQGTNVSGLSFADDSQILSATVTITPPLVKANNLKAVFNQGDKQVNLTWNVGSIAGNYKDFNWVVYRDGKKIATLDQSARKYSDKSFANETNPTYEVYYVSNFWNADAKNKNCMASVKLSTRRSVPVKNLKVESKSDRVVFTWQSDGYAAGFDNQFWIYIDGEADPAYKLKANANQTSFRWEHRTTDKHTNRQNKVEDNVPFTEEPLNACDGHTYTIKGVIGTTVLNTQEVNTKSIGNATLFYSLDASKGVHEGSVKLTWHVNQQGSTVAKTYVVERRRAEQENEAWEKLTRMSSKEEYLFFTDATALPGIYYDYRVTVEDKCSDGNTICNDISDIGFAKSSGTVTGRVAFGATGTSVQDVEVVMTKADNNSTNKEQFHAVYFNDANGLVTWKYPTANYAADIFASAAFTVQMWINPEDFNNGKIVNLGNNNALSMTADGKLSFNNLTFNDITLRKGVYNHVVLTRNGNTVTLYLLNKEADSDKPEVKKAAQTLSDNLSLKDAAQLELGHFKGSVDEFRLWTKCLAEADIVNNYDHLLVGDEQNLETYWTFDEGLHTQFFDYSRDGTNYRKHHGTFGNNAQTSSLTPSALALKAKSDNNGNYCIQGVPFAGEGTTYSVVPMFGIHEFNPNTKLVYVGKDALVHTVDFDDVSSFVMSGHIYYAGTNVPVEGAQMFVDGLLQTNGGEVQQTDANGYYEISVPIGNHFVEAKISGHNMVDNGRWPSKGTFYFDRHVQHDFSDATLVNFVGRIGGGLANDTLAVGHGVSKNNIGMATIQLALNNESFSLNCKDDHITDAEANRSWQSDTTSISSRSWTGTSYDAKYIYVRTDSLTGEFSALLPPLKFKIKSLRVDKNADIDFGALPEVDLTNVKAIYTDTLKVTEEDGTITEKLYSYNAKMVKTFFAEPQVELTQMSVSGDGSAPKGVFGRRVIENYADEFGKTDINDIWKMENGSVKYAFGYPIYDGFDQVRMEVRGYEAYINNDSKTAVADTIALNAQVVTISNEMSDEQIIISRVDDASLGLQPGDVYNLKKNQLVLDVNGRNEFTFTTGGPNITKPYTRQLSMSIERNNRTYNFDGVNAIVLGSLTTGTNFVTLGPDKVAMVLRDPPGSGSKTTWTTGSVKTKMKSTAHGFYGDEKMTVNFTSGLEVETHVGLGTLVEFGKVKNQLDKGAGFHYVVNRVNQTDESWTITATKSVSTGTGSAYVGASGDVFIGASTNIIVGNCRNLGFSRAGAGQPFTLNLTEGKSMGDSLTTTFMYSSYELEKVMIPKWEDTRRSLLTFVNSENEARSYVNNTDHCVYLTWLSPDDPTAGTDSKTYVQVLPKNAADHTFYTDSVEWCTDQINTWHQVMASNERDKVMAIEGTDYFIKNISFDGGSPNSYSSRNDTTYQYKSTYDHKLGGIFNIGTVQEGTGSSIVFKMTGGWSCENGWSMKTSEGDYDDNTKDYAQFDYSFNDGNKGTDFSVNVYKSPNGWSDCFYLVGGQSYNPYEGEERTKYYEKGNYLLSNGTEKMEQPNIRISLDGNADNSAKKISLNDVPAGQAGHLTLHLTNLNSTNQGFDFQYDVVVNDTKNQKGLEILMDGVPANGRSVLIPAGETVKKVITIRQTDQSVLDYDSLEILFCSKYQPMKINDAVNFDVHFKPSSSPITMTIAEKVMNIENMQRSQGNVEIKLSGFDRHFKGLKKLGVEYRYEGSTTWTQPSELQFVLNEADQATLKGNLLPEKGDLRLTYDMSNANLYPQGNYTFRAYTRTDYGTEPIYIYSDEITVVKDSEAPRQLTTPTPANGILGYGDDMVVEFNEDIVPGYVSDKNIIVTGKLNNQTIDHDVVKMLGESDEEQRTINPVFINDDYSVEFWMNWEKAGSILDHGKGRFVIGMDELGHMVINIAGAKMVSQDVIPANQWVFVAISCNTEEANISAIAQYGTTTVRLFTEQAVDANSVQAIDYYEDNYLYLGNMSGSIHDLCLYSLCRDLNQAAGEKYKAKNGYVYGLQNYWPMNEGHGTVARDLRHTHDFMTNNLWNVAYDNHAMSIREGKGVEANISEIATYPDQSYAIELWAQPSASFGQSSEQTVFETTANDSEKLKLFYNNKKDLVLQYADKQNVVASGEDFQNFNTWHHMALNVVRGQAASFYYDGQRTAVIAETDVPCLRGNSIRLGEGMGNGAHFDELRIWHATLSENRILNNMYNVIDTTNTYSRGLVAYFPFEKDGLVNNVPVKVATIENMAPGLKETQTMKGDIKNQIDQAAPALKGAPVEVTLMAKPTASERKVVINLSETSGISAKDIEGTTLNITVDKIHDMHGNQSDPIRWTAFVQRNTLKWAKDSVIVIKDLGTDRYIDVDIINKSGRTEYYTLNNMPEWLVPVDALDNTPIETTGEVAPFATSQLRFQVQPTVPVGNYDVTIGLQGNQEIMEPLRITMKVRGEMPNLTVNPDKYENTMSIVGQVYINGVLMANKESRVAAFIDGECRGVAEIQNIRNAAYVAMTVYGTSQEKVNGTMTDLDNGKPVTFRIWDASRGVAYSNVNISLKDEPVSITFDDTMIYGNFNQPVIFTKSELVEQELKLTNGWNWLSLGVEPLDAKTSVVLQDVSTWEVVIKDRATGTYFCNGSNWDGNMTEMHANNMYKMHLTRLSESEPLPNMLPVTGQPVKLSETKVTLKKGWNWLSYLPTTTMTLDAALAGANPQIGDQIKSQRGFAMYGAYGWDGDLKVLESGKGYLYYSVDESTKEFCYPNPTAAANSRMLQQPAARRASSFFTVDADNYPDNMTMVVKLVKNGEMLADTEIAAFINEECRGTATATVDTDPESASYGLYFLLISGEGHGKAMQLRAIIDGNMTTICKDIPFNSDAIIGTPWEPLVIDLDNTLGISNAVIDMTDSEWYTLDGFKIGHRPQAAGIYIHQGKKEVIK